MAACSRRPGSAAHGDAKDAGDLLKRRRRRGRRMRLRFARSVAQHTQRISLFHHVAHPVLRLHRIHLPDGGAGRKHFHQREAEAAYLVLHGAMNGAVGLRNLLVVSQANTLDVDRRFQGGQQLAHAQRIAFISGVAAVGRGRALLPQQRGGRGLPAGHAVDGVVYKNHGDVLAAIGRMQNLRRADGGEIAVALIADHDAVRPAALGRRCHRGRAPVRGLDVAHIEVVVSKDRAAHWADRGWCGPGCPARQWRGPASCGQFHGRSRGNSASGAATRPCGRNGA